MLQSGMVDQTSIANLTTKINAGKRAKNAMIDAFGGEQGLIQEATNGSFNSKWANGTAIGPSDITGKKLYSPTTVLTELKDNRVYSIRLSI